MAATGAARAPAEPPRQRHGSVKAVSWARLLHTSLASRRNTSLQHLVGSAKATAPAHATQRSKHAVPQDEVVPAQPGAHEHTAPQFAVRGRFAPAHSPAQAHERRSTAPPPPWSVICDVVKPPKRYARAPCGASGCSFTQQGGRARHGEKCQVVAALLAALASCKCTTEAAGGQQTSTPHCDTNFASPLIRRVVSQTSATTNTKCEAHQPRKPRSGRPRTAPGLLRQSLVLGQAQRRSCRRGRASPAVPAAAPAAVRRPAAAAAASAPRSARSSIAAVCRKRFSAVTMNGRTKFTCAVEAGSTRRKYENTSCFNAKADEALRSAGGAPPWPTRYSGECTPRWRRPACASHARFC